MSITGKIAKRIFGGFIILSVINYMFVLFIDNLNINIEIWVWNLSRFFESLVIFIMNMLFFTMLYGLRTWGVGQ